MAAGMALDVDGREQAENGGGNGSGGYLTHITPP